MFGFRIFTLLQLLFIPLSLLWVSNGHAATTVNEGEKPGERIQVIYWEKWADFEGDAMRNLVAEFNASQDRIEVVYVHVRDNRTKTLLATAGGNPPDVAGLFPEVLPKYAEKEAIIPLDSLMLRDNLQPARYLPAIISICRYKEHTWALPTTPTNLALYYNKRMFREAGLDPEKPPTTLEELESYARQLTLVNADGHIERIGFSPELPKWFRARWIYWFGGRIWDGKDKMLLNSDEFVAMLSWMQSFTTIYGLEPLQRFQASEGPFNSAQNLFISGRVGMQLQGVWMANFIERNNPKLDWGVAPFPSVKVGESPTTFVDCDVLVIPKGAKHPEEAWEFIRFVQLQKNMERLCQDQWKFSPLVQVSKSFYTNHPNPRIQLFRDLAESSNAIPAPRLAIFDDVRQELDHAIDSVLLLQSTPREAAQQAQDKVQARLNRQVHQWQRVEEERLRSWYDSMTFHGKLPPPQNLSGEQN